MPRILSIDYGKKRTGLAVTDPLQIIANGLKTVETKDLFDFLSQYVQKRRSSESLSASLCNPMASRRKTWQGWRTSSTVGERRDLPSPSSIMMSVSPPCLPIEP